MKSPRFWAVMVLILIAAAVLERRGNKDSVPPSTPLNQLPYSIGRWTGTDVTIPSDALTLLGQGEFVNRIYTVNQAPSNSPRLEDSTPISPDAVGLLIAYFPTQRTGQSIHSPQNCLPGAGWTFVSTGTTDIPLPNRKPARVGEYLIANANSRAEVLYWYQTRGNIIANDYRAKLSMLASSIRYNRTDAALVRIVVPMVKGESRQAARQRALAFATATIPLLPTYIPS